MPFEPNEPAFPFGAYSKMLSASCSCAPSIMCSSTCLSAIVLLHTFTCTLWFLELVLVNGATLTVVNNCTQTIWPANSGTPSLDKTGFELPVGGTRVLQAPGGWIGKFWGRTGCKFNATNQGSCVTGDCGSGQIECNGADTTAVTLAGFAIRFSQSTDYYEIFLTESFNLPLLIEGKSGSGQRCESTGCTEDLNRLCPAELRSETGDACHSACVGPTASLECKPTEYSQLFKNACPKASSFSTDHDTSRFNCSSGDYRITFCPSPFSLQNEKCTRPFQCGSIRNISYPFWGANRPEICGFPGFELFNCQGDVPMLTIDSKNYRVLEIDYSSHTLKVARQDLWNNTCPRVLHNTTFDRNLFSFPQNYTDENLTLYYNCTKYQSQLQTSSGDQWSLTDRSPVRNGMNHTNQFTCNIDMGETLNFFAVGKSSELGSNVTCNNNISVPVNHSAAQTLSTDSATTKDLQDALAGGFSIQWLNNIGSCQGCVQSGGVCGYDLNLASIICNISGRMLKVVAPTIALSPGPSPLYNTDVGDPPAHSPGPRFSILIGMTMIVTVAVVAALIIVYIRRRRRFKRLQLGLNQETNTNVENFLLNHENLAPKTYNYSQIKKITNSFSDKLGQGGYGSVYKGTLPNGQFVAVKLLTETKNNIGEDFVNEVASISRTSHVNIVNLLGFCHENNKRALVYEFMPNKSLDNFISSSGSLNTHCSLNWETLYNIAVGVARGLEYLHKGCNTRIVHFDIKPQNILLDEEFCPKISDFGLAKLCKKKQSILSMAGTRGTIGYIAPEVFSRNFGAVSHKSDVYSYGMMVLEMTGARNIVGPGSVQSSENYFPDKIYEQAILQETKNLEAIASEGEEEATRKMFFVGFWCIQTVPSERPSMSKVVEMLEGSLQSIQIPPKPYLFTPVSVAQELSSSASGNTEVESCIEENKLPFCRYRPSPSD